MPKSVLRWIGGKAQLASWIASKLPEHKCLVIVFGGGAGFLLNKEPSYLEVYNDLDSELWNFFLVLKQRPWELAAALQWMPVSREWLKYIDKDSSELSSVERAAKLFYISNIGFSGTRDANLPATTMKRSYRNKIVELIDFANRLTDVVIENLDFKNVIKRYDSPNTVFYCDPPYAGINYYDEQFTEEDHRNLALVLHNIKGKACVSYYPHPLVSELYTDGKWHCATKEVPTHASGKETKTKQTELLITNYNPDKDKWEGSKHNTLDNYGFPETKFGSVYNVPLWENVI